MKKQLLSVLFLALFSQQLAAQSTYTSTNYAAVGDSFYITNANDLVTDFETTGTNHTWDFSTLTGTSQNYLQFRSPTATGVSIFLFPYIYNSNNTNLSSTDGTSNTLSFGGQTIGITDKNDYFKKSTTELKQVASSYKLDYNGTQIPVPTQYTSPDVVYAFPINFGNTNTSNSEYTTNIPSVYYQNHTMTRTNVVDGWGTVTTPYGTFPNALRMTTTLVQNDTIAIIGNGLPRVIRTTRELKWLDTSKKYPVLIVTQSNTGSVWTTTNVQFIDNPRDFQTTALFAYSPLAPTAGATVYFQNLSSNATTYTWDFGDPTSGTSNASSDEFPTHIFAANGTYLVLLTASNGTFSDTITIPVVVSDVLGTSPFDTLDPAEVFPNPFSNQINVSGLDDTAKFELYDVTGKLQYEGKAINKTDFSYLSKGIYLLKVSTEKGFRNFKMIK